MQDMLTTTPVVLSINSLDPSGGGGISAGIETLASLGCHCTPIISQLAARDTNNEIDNQITDSLLLVEQIRAVLADIPVHLFNIGELASIGNIEAMHTILNDYPDIPVVLHFRLDALDKKIGLDQALCNLLLPQTHLLILNKHDALALAPGADNLSAGAQELLEYGCDNILICNSNDGNPDLYNHWFSSHSNNQCYQWQRLPDSFLGAADTLAAAASGYLAHGLSLAESIQQAQKFTWESLKQGKRFGMGDLLPDRMHWSKN